MKTATSSSRGGRSSLDYLPPARVCFSAEAKELARALVDSAIDSGCLAQGPLVRNLEQRFAELSAVRHAVATNSGTSALEAALRALDVRGRKVIIPADTFVATAAAVINAGGIPVICDIASPKEPVLDPATVSSLIDGQTAGVIVVHIGGFVWPQVSTLARICREKGVFLLEDAAHAHGAALDGMPAGSFGLAAAFSLFSTKVVTSGEGGVLVTNDQELAEAVRRQVSHGRLDGTDLPQTVGQNLRMSEIGAAVALAHLSDYGKQQAVRNSAAGRYNKALDAVKSLAPLAIPEGCEPNWYKFIAMPTGRRSRGSFPAGLARHGVALSGAVFEYPLTRVPALRPYVHTQTPNAERFCAAHICLPVYGDMRPSECRRVIGALNAIES